MKSLIKLLVVFFVLSTSSFAGFQAIQLSHDIHDFSGQSSSDQFASYVSGVGDVNNDGFDDVIVGAPADDTNGTNAGNAKVYSGKNGSVLYSINGQSFVTFGDMLGSSVSGTGDVNGDGFSDFIVGSPFANNNGLASGNVKVFSGQDGSVLYSIHGDSIGDHFGFSVSGGGDVDADGIPDFIASSYIDNLGYVKIFSGQNGNLIRTIIGLGAPGFGYTVSDVGDVNGDGYDDVIVGSSGKPSFQNPRAIVYSGLTSLPLYSFSYTSIFPHNSISVSGVGDINSDGRADFIVGIPNPLPFGNTSQVSVYSGSDGSAIYEYEEGGSFGSGVSGIGDVDADGTPDFVVNYPETNEVIVYSGNDGQVVHRYTHEGGASGGNLSTSAKSISGAGDVNGDGFPDIILGRPLNSPFGNATVLSGIPLTFSTDVKKISMSQGGTQTLTFKGPSSGANLTYAVLGTTSGTSPGVEIGVVNPVTVPLNLDAYTDFTLNNPNNFLMPNSFGTLDAQGDVTVTFTLAPGLIGGPSWEGVKLHHSFLVFDSAGVLIFASNPILLKLVL